MLSRPNQAINSRALHRDRGGKLEPGRLIATWRGARRVDSCQPKPHTSGAVPAAGRDRASSAPRPRHPPYQPFQRRPSEHCIARSSTGS